jgi:ABC-type nitrate/sulfonate/bicarbonate transport system permease component
LSPEGREPHRLACRAKASTGLGALLWLSWQILKVEDMYATFFVIALLGAVLSYGLAALRARWLPCVQDVRER